MIPSASWWQQARRALEEIAGLRERWLRRVARQADVDSPLVLCALDGGADPLLEGLQDARLVAGLAQVREMMSLQHLGDHLDRYAAMMVGLPQMLDDMLTLGSEGGARVKLHVPEAASHRRRNNSSSVTTALLLAFAAITLLLPHVTASLAAGAWADRINAVAFVLAGAVLLHAVSRA